MNNGENPNHSKKKKTRTKTVHPKKPVWVCEYRNYRSNEDRVVLLETLREYAQQIIKRAAENPNCFTVEDLFIDDGIPMRTYYSWVEKYDFFREAHENAVLIMGRRREKNGLTRKWDSLNSMHQYNKRWLKSEEWKASLKEKNKDSDKNITVVMEPFAKQESESPPLRLSESPPLKKTAEEVAGEITKKIRDGHGRGHG